jgi:LysR family transcriptional regulator, low CO2-responsive transcriptional regulator
MKNPIDSRQLRAFLSLAKHGSFTVAAKELSLTQSAVSHSMRALEEDLGCRLFDRMGKTILLTLAGEQLLPHAEEILKRMEMVRVGVHKLSQWGQSRLRVCASPTACQYILPGVLRDFQKTFPKVQVTIESGDTHQAMDLLTEKKVDCAICLEPERQERFTFKPLFTDELMFVVSVDHPWAKIGRVERDDIAAQKYVLYNKGTYTFGLIEKYFLAESIELNTVIELRNMEAIKEFVKLGLGTSILAPWVVAKEIRERVLCAFPLGRRKLQRQWGVLHWSDPNLPLVQTHFVEICKRACMRLTV